MSANRRRPLLFPGAVALAAVLAAEADAQVYLSDYLGSATGCVVTAANPPFTTTVSSPVGLGKDVASHLNCAPIAFRGRPLHRKGIGMLTPLGSVTAVEFDLDAIRQATDEVLDVFEATAGVIGEPLPTSTVSARLEVLLDGVLAARVDIASAHDTSEVVRLNVLRASSLRLQVSMPGLPFSQAAWGDAQLSTSESGVVGFGDDSRGQRDLPALPSVVEITAGRQYSVARRSDGTVVAWGDDLFGQTNVPPLPVGLSYVEIVGCWLHALARRSDGTVVAWGYNFDGQTNVPALPAGLTYVEIAGGDSHSMARRSDGTVVAWGANWFGQSNVPALPAGLSYVEIAAQGNHSLARRSDGSVVAWGANFSGQSNVPALPAGVRYVEVAAGLSHSLARRSDGTVVAWGANSSGQTNVPTLPAGLTYVEIAAGRMHSVARRSDGTVVAWGNNAYSQTIVPALPAGVTYVEIAVGGSEDHSLARRSDGVVVGWGDGSSGAATMPADLLPTYTAIDGGEFHGLALRSDGRITAFGDNADGQLDVPPLPAGERYEAVAAGFEHSMALRTDGEIVTFGGNAGGQLNTPALPAGLTYVGIAAGRFHSLALRSDGSAVGWGANASGQTVVPPLAPGLSFVDLDTAAGSFWSLALVSDGSLRAFGDDTYGQISQLPSGNDFVEISAGIQHGTARRADGTLVSWGDDSSGQVSQLPGATYSALASGWLHSLAVRRDGEIDAWGFNGSGQVSGVSPAPDGFAYVDVAAGSFNSYARYERRGIYAPAAGIGELSFAYEFINSPPVGSRAQAIYDASHFEVQGHTTPVDIDRLQWRLNGGATNVVQTWPQVEIWLDHCAKDHASPSTTFADNRSAGHTLVYSGPLTTTVASGAMPNDWVLDVELDTPFRYDPALGEDLMLEVVITGTPSPAGNLVLSSSFDVAVHACQVVESIASNTATTGSFSPYVPVVRFGYRPVRHAASHEEFGAGCYDGQVSFYELFPGQYPQSSNDLSGRTVTLTPNQQGGYDVVTTAGAVVVPPTGTGLGLPDDGPSNALPLGFTFPYAGDHTTTEVWAHSNGSVTFDGPGATSMFNATTPAELLQNARHVLSPAMHDFVCDGTTNVRNVFAEPGVTGEYLITWWDLPSWRLVPSPNPNLSRFQVALFPDGRIELRYEALFNEAETYNGAMLTGFSLGGGAMDPGGADLSNEVVQTRASDSLPLTLRASQRPVLGGTVDYILDNATPTLGISTILASLVPVDPGQPLTGLGIDAPGCSYMISPFANVPFSPLLLGSPTVSFAQSWPASPAFAGLEIALQGLHLDPSANVAGVTSSNGLRARLDVN